MNLMVLALVAMVAAAIPARLFLANLRAFQPPPSPRPGRALPRVSILIPARDEERCIRACVESVLASKGVELEVLVLDDYSSDETAPIVKRVAATDPRVRLLRGKELPGDWCGKQFACSCLAEHARFEYLLFLDADVRLMSDGLSRLVAFMEESKADLVSGLPFQETQTVLEQLVIPMIHFVLLGLLPIGRMRAFRNPAYGAGFGQLFLTKILSYEEAGGHASIRNTLHDGIELPRSFRRSGLVTDICDATPIARCRMYRSATELWRGLAKNATEGLGAPALIVPSTLLFLAGQIAPVILVGFALWHSRAALVPAAIAMILAYYPRFASIARFRQPVFGALLHPIGMLLVLLIQWYALLAHLLGRPRNWKGRVYG